jgi:hypothetical protein
MMKKARLLPLFLLPAIITTAAVASEQSTTLAQSQLADPPRAAQMLQFTSAGHVLGFERSGIYVASGSHVLRESFAGTVGVAPKADRPPAADGRTQPLGKVSYPGLWPGITLIYDRPPGGIVRSTFQLAPGADPGRIGLHYNVPVHLDAAGNLVFEFETGTMTACPPVAWQNIEGRRLPVNVAFHVEASDSIVHFSLGAYNPAFTLFIDPIMSWNTFMGSSTHDFAYAVAADSDGNVYVAGYSDDNWGIRPVSSPAGGGDAFAAKLDSSGARLWHTFMGSSAYDCGRAIFVDGSGNVYVAGGSDATWGSPVNNHAGGADGFAAKLDSSGERQWHTFMGSSSEDGCHAIVVEGSELVYVAGYSNADWGTPLNAHAGDSDAFVAKLTGGGEQWWHTFMGSTGTDRAFAVIVGGDGSVYVAGDSNATWGSPVNNHAGGVDGFAAKLNGSGVRQWHTFMGSTGTDHVFGVTVGGDGNVYVVGESNAAWGSPVNAYAGGYDAFAAGLLSDSGARQWNTFMGSSSSDYGRGIAADGEGGVYVAGSSYLAWGSPVNAHAGDYDAFAAKLDSGGARRWHTFMGSSEEDGGEAIELDGRGNVYVAGYNFATWGSPVNVYMGLDDAFAAKIIDGAMTPGIPLLLLDSSSE